MRQFIQAVEKIIAASVILGLVFSIQSCYTIEVVTQQNFLQDPDINVEKMITVDGETINLYKYHNNPTVLLKDSMVYYRYKVELSLEDSSNLRPQIIKDSIHVNRIDSIYIRYMDLGTSAVTCLGISAATGIIIFTAVMGN